MKYQSQSPGGFTYSDIEAQSNIDESISSFIAGVGVPSLAAGAVLFSMNKTVGGSSHTIYDVVQKSMRNAMMWTPFGIGNTFRVAEFMEPFLSPMAKGLEYDEVKKNFFFEFDPRDLQNQETKKVLKATLGKDQYEALDDLTKVHQGVRLRYEEEPSARGRGKLFALPVEPEVTFYKEGEETLKKTTYKPRKGAVSKLIASDVTVMSTVAGPEFIDYPAGFQKAKLNPATQGVLQSANAFRDLDVSEINRVYSHYETRLDTAGKKVQEKVHSRFAIVPSVVGKVDGMEDLVRRSSMLTSYLSAGINRFNRLIDATYEQVPLFGKIGKALEEKGLGLKTKPDNFFKMYMKFGLNAMKIGGTYLALEELDHIRRDFGAAGNVVVSGGLSAGLFAAMRKKVGGKNAFMTATASFFGQLALPGFDQGVLPGVANTMVNLDIGRSYVGKFTGMSAYRRTIEGFLPGATDFTTGAFLGVGVLAASYLGAGKKLVEKDWSILPKAIRDRVGFSSGTTKFKLLNQGSYSSEWNQYARGLEDFIHTKQQAPDDIFSRFLSDFDSYKKTGSRSGLQKVLRLRSFLTDNLSEIDEFKADTLVERKMKLKDFLYEQHYEGILRHREFYKSADNIFQRSYLEKVGEIQASYAGQDDLLSKAKQKIQLFGTQMYHGFFGASFKGEEFAEEASDLGIDFKVKRAGALFFGTMALHQLFTGSLFGTMEDPSELTDIYAGRQLVEVKKGRWWEGGGTPYEGAETSYLRPHAYHLFMTRANEKSVWGEDEDTYHPISKFFLKNFTYHLEETNYYNRPYPISSTAFEDLPIVGPLLGATIGRLIKPPKLMHVDEFTKVNPDTGEVEFKFPNEYNAPVQELGGVPVGKPISPYSLSALYGDYQYRFRELEGLTGYAKNLIQKGLTGRETLGTTKTVLASARNIDSSIESFWEKELGGFFFMSEPLRRIFPRPRSEIEEYNPIQNIMPTWLPNRFKVGDPYRKVDMGQARLPGAGYEALHPELKGRDPEEYPDIYKYKILSDVAPLSKEYRQVKFNLYERRAEGITTEAENALMDQVDQDLKRITARRTDFEAHKNAIQLPGSGLTQHLYSSGLSLAKQVSAVVEQAPPAFLTFGLRPFSKLMTGEQDIVTRYEYENLYGTNQAFWDKPWRDSLRPALYSAAHLMGYDSKPLWVKERNETNEFFDKLKFFKMMKLAEASQNTQERKFFLREAANTRHGVNPQGDAMSIYMSLPDSEKRFFDAFTNANEDQRQRILEIIPEDQNHLYRSIWKRIDSQDDSSLYPIQTTSVDEQYLQEQYLNLGQYFKDKPMPESDWIGWHKDVNVDDVKLKYIQNLGKDIHDHGMYNSNVRQLARKPYLQGSDKFMYQGAPVGRSNIYQELKRFAPGNSSMNLLVNSHSRFNPQTDSRITFNDDRRGEISNLADGLY